MRRRPLLPLLVAATITGAIGGGQACLADGQGVLVQALGNRLIIGAGDDTPGGQQIGQRVFGDRFPSNGINDDPSFFSLSTPPGGLETLPVGSDVFWDFLPVTIDGTTANLFHWDSEGPVEFAPAAVEKVSLFDVTNTNPATVDGSAAAVPGERIGTVTGDFLSLHAHRFWSLLGEGGDPLLGGGATPASGVYLTALRLRVEGFVPSEPFFVALSTSGTPSAALDNEALPWIEANLDDLILQGDYNYDGLVDTTDHQLWSSQYGAATPQPVDTGEADGNGDGVINAIDYAIWRDQLDSNAVAATAAVPETTGVGIALAALLVATFRLKT